MSLNINMHKVLIVEDERDIALLVEQFFQANQFATSLVHDGAEVLKAFELFAPDLIIMDISLPNKTGVQCCFEGKGRSHQNVGARHPLGRIPQRSR